MSVFRDDQVSQFKALGARYRHALALMYVMRLFSVTFFVAAITAIFNGQIIAPIVFASATWVLHRASRFIQTAAEDYKQQAAKLISM